MVDNPLQELRPEPAREHNQESHLNIQAGELAKSIAALILEGFNRHYSRFRDLSCKAKQHYEQGNWPWMQTASRERIAFYDQRVEESLEQLANKFSVADMQATDWQLVKQNFIASLSAHKQPECAETFFNSVCCRILHRDYFHNDFIFFRPGVAVDHMDSEPPSFHSYYPTATGVRTTLEKIVGDFALNKPFVNLRRDLRLVLRRFISYLPRPFWTESDCQLQVLSSLFFRNKGAYIVGRFINANASYAFSIPILRNSKGELYLDTLLFGPESVGALFSFSRAYFLVDMEAPAAYSAFLHSLLPNIPVAEIYSMVGLQKQGKTLFYRDFLYHLKHSSDQFVLAPGTKGLVMVVFTLPSYPYVFKVIRDHMGHPKKTTPAKVKEKYQLVKYHDRVGRMADTWEYSQVALPRSRFSPELIDELHTLAPSVLENDGDKLVIRHVYTERRMIPLNLYLQRAGAEDFAHAAIEYGNAIKDMASANIFAGDMLLKNFGVTRLGRVVFYDYDEVCYLTECNFRAVPEPRSPEDELASEPWYAVAENDVFPAQFSNFVLGNSQLREIFMRHHADLLDPASWQAKQQRIQQGMIENVFPYSDAIRFRNSL